MAGDAVRLQRAVALPAGGVALWKEKQESGLELAAQHVHESKKQCNCFACFWSCNKTSLEEERLATKASYTVCVKNAV